MADIIRTAKSGSNWTKNELNAYNISVTLVDSIPFFGVQLREIEPSVDDIVATSTIA